jgi:hypothetical protein
VLNVDRKVANLKVRQSIKTVNEHCLHNVIRWHQPLIAYKLWTSMTRYLSTSHCTNFVVIKFGFLRYAVNLWLWVIVQCKVSNFQAFIFNEMIMLQCDLYWTNRSLFLPLNAACLTEQQQIIQPSIWCPVLIISIAVAIQHEAHSSWIYNYLCN